MISLAEIATEGRRKLLTLIKMYDVSPLPPIVQKWRQSISKRESIIIQSRDQVSTHTPTHQALLLPWAKLIAHLYSHFSPQRSEAQYGTKIDSHNEIRKRKKIPVGSDKLSNFLQRAAQAWCAFWTSSVRWVSDPNITSLFGLMTRAGKSHSAERLWQLIRGEKISVCLFFLSLKQPQRAF